MKWHDITCIKDREKAIVYVKQSLLKSDWKEVTIHFWSEHLQRDKEKIMYNKYHISEDYLVAEWACEGVQFS